MEGKKSPLEYRKKNLDLSEGECLKSNSRFKLGLSNDKSSKEDKLMERNAKIALSIFDKNITDDGCQGVK